LIAVNQSIFKYLKSQTYINFLAHKTNICASAEAKWYIIYLHKTLFGYEKIGVLYLRNLNFMTIITVIK